MSTIMDIYTLVKDLIHEARSAKNEELVSKLIDIKSVINDLVDENKQLAEKLRIKDNMVYSEDCRYFTLPDKPNIHYCSVCYGYEGKLIPMDKHENRYHCRICWERETRSRNGG